MLDRYEPATETRLQPRLLSTGRFGPVLRAKDVQGTTGPLALKVFNAAEAFHLGHIGRLPSHDGGSTSCPRWLPRGLFSYPRGSADEAWVGPSTSSVRRGVPVGVPFAPKEEERGKNKIF